MEFTELPDLASARVGGRALYANDEFFAARGNLVKPGPAVFIPGKYTSRGKWMDGWETRRRRTPGHDWCVLRLGLRGVIRGVDVDTSHFNGNQPERASLEACDLAVPASQAAQRAALAHAAWVEVLSPSPCGPSCHNPFAVSSSRPFTHVRLNIHPDGGVARLRVHGEPAVDPHALRGKLVDLAALVHGGIVLAASDQHFGSKDHLILAGPSRSMADGWETRRRRGPGHDWAIVRLGAPGTIDHVEVDTSHFKGNYPESCALDGCHAPGVTLGTLTGDAMAWRELLPRTPLRPHAHHRFARELLARGPFTHVRLRTYPDGGIARLRIHGRVDAP
jgi:allantoicase